MYRVEGSLFIKDDGVVLRGAGQTSGGTTIIATQRNAVPLEEQRALVYVGDTEVVLPRLAFLQKEKESKIAKRRVPVGARGIVVESSTGFNVGDKVILQLFPNMKWLEVLGLEKEWGDDLKMFYHRFEYEIVGIDGDRLVLDAPILYFIDTDFLDLEKSSVWTCLDRTRISNCGVEGLRLVSAFKEGDYLDEGHSIIAVSVNDARDCWVENVTAVHFSFAAVRIDRGGRNITVQDCAFIRPVSLVEGSRRYAFHVLGSRCLVQRCYARNARHSFASGVRTTGPNVFLDCLAEKGISSIGPHHRWDVGFLYDNVSSPYGRIQVQNSGAASNHGWEGANHVFWNCEASAMLCDAPRTKDCNWNVGALAPKRPGRIKEHFGSWISPGVHVAPRSLYLLQLERRLGRAAVSNIVIEQQLSNDGAEVYAYLKGALCEMDAREKANERNLVVDPEFRHVGKGGRNTWNLAMVKDVGKLERTANPVYGDETALNIPAGDVLRTESLACISSSDLFKTDVHLRLCFDCKAGKDVAVKASALHQTMVVEVDGDGFPNQQWQSERTFNGPSMKASGEWQRYEFDFTLNPRFCDKMPYPYYVRLSFSANGVFAIANPSLEVVDDGLSPISPILR